MYPIKKAFTLFELMMVVIIIGSAYALLIPSIQFEKKKNFEFTDLKGYMESFDGEDKRELVCIEECKKCYVYIGDKKYESDFIKESLDAYMYKDGYLEQKEFYDPQKIDVYDEICLKYTYNKKSKIGDELIVEYREKAYYFPPYFGEVQIFESAGELSDFISQKLQDLKD